MSVCIYIHVCIYKCETEDGKERSAQQGTVASRLPAQNGLREGGSQGTSGHIWAAAAAAKSLQSYPTLCEIGRASCRERV